MDSIVLREHERYDKIDRNDRLAFIVSHNVELVGSPDIFMGEPIRLGVNKELEASYYIGASWIVKNELPMLVLPKIDNLDFTDMLITALSVSSENEGEYFSKCYGIDFEEPLIETRERMNQLTPILLIHYITLLEKVVRSGLKKGYVSIDENLKGKIKGHICLSEQLRCNIIPQRQDRNYCRFQIYTSDIPENRLLKKALLFSQLMLSNMMLHSRHTAKIQNRINKLNRAFDGISDNIEQSQVKTISSNKLFRHYPDAIRIAKDILRRFDYSISNISSDNHKTPPFWIDMSRLFELYVYSKLEEVFPKQILFQVSGYGQTKADYIHVGERIIIDAKYKPKYDYSFELADIREISGYSRDLEILKHFGQEYVDSQQEPKCLIIYPTIEEHEVIYPTESLWSHGDNIGPYRNFRKMGIHVPIKQHN